MYRIVSCIAALLLTAGMAAVPADAGDGDLAGARLKPKNGGEARRRPDRVEIDVDGVRLPVESSSKAPRSPGGSAPIIPRDADLAGVKLKPKNGGEARRRPDRVEIDVDGVRLPVESSSKAPRSPGDSAPAIPRDDVLRSIDIPGDASQAVTDVIANARSKCAANDIPACTWMIKRYPNDAADAYFHRASAYYRESDDSQATERAIADYGEAIRINPSWVEAYTRRAEAYKSKMDYDRAIADYTQAIRLDPKFAIAYNSRGAAYLNGKEDYDRAISDYDQAIRLDPGLAAAREGRERAQAALAARPDPTPVPIFTERRVALVIGNSAYTSSLVSALPNPRRDAKLVADGLRQAGFDVMELVDLDRYGMAKALGAFRSRAASADWALVYFAGHGIEINRVNYLIPVDATLADSGDVELETVSYEAVLNAVGGARSLRVIVLDACRNNPFKAQMRQTSSLRGSLDRGLAAPPETRPGTLVVYSAKEGQAAVDGDRDNSPFALAFVTRLKKPGREVQRMFDDVRDDVLQATNERQEPYKYGSLPGARDFFFIAGR